MDEPKRYKLTKKEIELFESYIDFDRIFLSFITHIINQQAKIMEQRRLWWEKALKRLKLSDDVFMYTYQKGEIYQKDKSNEDES